MNTKTTAPRLRVASGTQSGLNTISPDAPATFAVDGVEVTIPAGCRAVTLAPRKSGDFYAEISGKGFCRSATGESALEALAAAIDLIPVPA